MTERQGSKRGSDQTARLASALRPHRILVLALALLLAVVASASAVAAGDTPDEAASLVPSQSDVAAAIESGKSEGLPELTDLSAAEDVPLEGLQRTEAVELLDGVFGGPVEAAAGIYDELQEATLLSPHVAVLPEPDPAGADESATGSEGGEPQPENSPGRDEVAEAMPEAEGLKDNGPPLEVPAQPADASLVDSTVPLEVGNEETLDLSLERNKKGTLEPVAPLVSTRIPGDLNDEIEFPETGISIKVDGLATERSASISSGSVAFYPNVAEDTDLAISPTPGGVETLTQLRSAESPDVSTYRFSLPSGASLVATEEGGAEVRSGEDLLLSVPAPAAIDAAGEAVPVDLEISGDTLKVQVEPDAGASLPILVDPLFQTYEWSAKNTSAGICSNSIITEYGESSCSNREEWGYEVSAGNGSPPHINVYPHQYGPPYAPGIGVHAGGSQVGGSRGAVVYAVPRYFKENPPPTSFIKTLKVSNMRWEALGPSASPYAYMGIWDYVNKGWIESWSHTGQVEHGVNEPAFVYNFENKAPNKNGKLAQLGIWATEATADSGASLYAGYASVELGDNEAPQQPVPTIQSAWVGETAPPLQFSTGDTGLGVFAISASTEELDSSGQPLHTWKAANGCIGVGDSACPVTWNSSRAKQPLTYDPRVLPTGINYLKLVAEDPVGNKSTGAWEEVRVDHLAPAVSLSGAITEQDRLGTRRATYVLKATGSDGNTEHPQSGIAKAEVKVDGKAVAMEGKQAEEWSPKCTTQNCPLAAEWTLDTAGLAEGKHTVEVVASDAVGNSTTKTLTIETRVATAPSISLSGSMTEQGTLGTSRPRYVLKAKSTASSAGFEAPSLGSPPAYVSALGGTKAEEPGHFYEPADAATDSQGNIWVLDSGTRTANQLQEFNQSGEWLRSAGTPGSVKLNAPWGVSVDSAGNVWVADTGNNRIVEFNEKGVFVETFGTNVNKTKVEAAGTEAEKNLCTAASGNVCQAATAGSASGQLKTPRGIALTSGGNIWVVDTGNSRLEKFASSGALLNTLSGEGAEPGKLSHPRAITAAPDGSIWVADTGNHRIEQWNSSLAFVRAVGTLGTGPGQLTDPWGIEADSTGAIWVSDLADGKVQEFDERGAFLQEFLDAAGTAGSPAGLAVDPTGSIWIADWFAPKIYRWTIPGFPVYNSSVGSLGSGNSQFTHLAAVASDGSKGHVWALDQELGRLQEFGEKGEWLRSAGSKGSGAGMLSSPSGVGSSSAGNVWVADTGNNRIVEFNEKGEFVLTFGTGVNKTKVEAAGTEAEKNLCTAASGNVCQAATAGSAAGQLKSPKGIAVTSGGNLWVADTGNNRIEKFSSTGGLLSNVSGEGTEPGKLKEPAAITVAPDGSIWVADTGNNRIQQWNPNLALVHTVGKEGSGGGEFKAPAAIFADPSGNIWVGDQKNNRIEEFGEGGKYRGQFGAAGSGKFSFSAPMGITSDNGGSIWVTDPGHSKIQRWSQETPSSEITTTISMDGVQKMSLHGACKTATCTIEPWWTLESLDASAGSHTALVKTTDGLGRSTERTLSFVISRDTTKPTLEATGELVNAPEGWVEQETYGIGATATDAGYGVTSINFKIDGQQIASASQTCAAGGCQETLSKQVSMASYAGGSHAAELVATDGAINSAVKKWTINVDPTGAISTSEAEGTLEALESTSDGNPIGTSQEEPGLDGTAAGLTLAATQEGLVAEGSEVPAKVPVAPDKALSLEILPDNAFDGPCEKQEESEEMDSESELIPFFECKVEDPSSGENELVPLSVTPVAVSGGAGNTALTNGAAAISANTSANVDTITRPLYDGALTFKALRDTSAPESFSWRVGLEAGQTMKALDAQHVEVYYASGHEAFSIAAEPAHDAIGTSVPTTIAVAPENQVVLTVHHHSAQFVYPVLAGVGWQGGFVSAEIQGPQDEQELREERERIAEEEQEARESLEAGSEVHVSGSYEGAILHLQAYVQGPPVYLGRVQEARDLPEFSHQFKFNDCRYRPVAVAETNGGTIPPEQQRREGMRVTHCANSAGDRELLAAESVHGHFNISPGVFVSIDDPVKCNKWGSEQPKKIHCDKKVTKWSTQGWREQIEVYGNFRFAPGKGAYFIAPAAACVTVHGTINRSPTVLRQPETIVSPAQGTTNGHPEVQEPCNWP